MSGKKDASRNGAYDKVVAKLNEAQNIQQEQKDVVEVLEDFKEKLNNIFMPMLKFPDEIDAEMRVMLENKELLEFGLQLSTDALHDVEAACSIRAQKQDEFLQAQQDELAAVVKDLAVEKAEYASVQAVLKEKQRQIAEMRRELRKETSTYEEQMKTLNALKASKKEEKRKKSLESNKECQAESDRLDNIILMERAENHSIRQATATMMEELTAIEEKNRLQRAAVAKLEARFQSNKETLGRLERENHKLSSKSPTGEQKRKEELDRLEQQLSECRAEYDKAKKAHDEVTAKLKAEIGDCGSYEETMAQAEKQLGELNNECYILSKRFNEANDKKIANEKKLKQLEEKKNQLIREMNRNVSAVHGPTQTRDLKQPANQPLLQQRERHVQAIATRAQNVSVQHPNPRKKRGKKSMDRRRAQALLPLRPTVRNADSSVADSWASPTDFREQFDEKESARHMHSVELYKKLF